MSLEPINKFDRIISILIQLQSKRIVKAQDLADRFEVSLRTIYRDIRSLQTAGVPIASEAGVGYELVEGYRLPPVMFTKEEATSFVAAEKLVERFIDPKMAGQFTAALTKMKAVLRMAEKDHITNIESQVLVRGYSQQIFNEKVPEALSVLFNSVAQKQQVEIEYKKTESDAAEKRLLEPVGLVHEHEFWYIMAWCHLRRDYRKFRTDRIQTINQLDLAFTKEHPELEYFLEQRKQLPKTKVRILVPPELVRHLQWEKNNHGFLEEKNTAEGVEMTFMTPYAESDFARWFISFGQYAKILEPESLKKHLRKVVSKQLELLNEK